MTDHPNMRPFWWEATLIWDHFDEKLLWYETLWWETTLMRDHTDERPRWQTNWMRNHSDERENSAERPPWWESHRLTALQLQVERLTLTEAWPCHTLQGPSWKGSTQLTTECELCGVQRGLCGVPARELCWLLAERISWRALRRLGLLATAVAVWGEAPVLGLSWLSSFSWLAPATASMTLPGVMLPSPCCSLHSVEEDGGQW